MNKTPAEVYYVSFNGKVADLMDQYKRIIRRFTTQSKIVNAVVSGYGKDAVVAITQENGQTILYKSNGTIIRR